MLDGLLLTLALFLLGSIPFGFYIGRALGIDVRNSGSGNTGATNVARVAGKKAGLLTLVLDVAKGALAACLAFYFSPNVQFAPLFASISVYGHCFSPFLKWKGGKGVATALGVLLYLTPLLTLVACLVFIVVAKSTGYVSVASISAALLIPILVGLFEGNSPLFYACLLVAALVVFRHSTNIKRLKEGTEARFNEPVQITGNGNTKA